MSNATTRSLKIIQDNPGIRPRWFAKLYFPKDHPGWRRYSNAGGGVVKGGGLVMWSGAWLGKLRKKGLVTDSNLLTDEGREMLRVDS